MRPLRLTAVLLAAGRSSRMGTQKALLPLGAESVVERIIRVIRQSGVSTIRVVTGHRQEMLMPLLQAAGVEPVTNPNFTEGMFSSVKTGLSGLDAECTGALVMPVDVPLVRSWTIRELIRHFDSDPNRILYPVFHGERGHPPLIPIWKIPEILDWQGTGGLRACLAQSDALSANVPVPDCNILFDMDTPDDYTEATRRWKRREVPTAAECEAILRETHPVSEEVFRHCHQVARVADAIASALLQTGQSLDAELVLSAALLHDIAKERLSHAEIGDRWLTEMGFARTGAVVASHTNIAVSKDGPVSESEIVYIADKYVSGDSVVPLRERFQKALSRYGRQVDIQRRIQKRENAAILINQRIEKLLGESIPDIIKRSEIPNVSIP
ncbi:MAG: NTP transferase domain-containing protein [Desulfobacterales bacterium]